jgi:hypothetical protein
MTIVHKTIMDARSLFNELDESVLPGLIDGEKRNVSKYDDALKDTKISADIINQLAIHRGRIAQKITQMETQSDTQARVVVRRFGVRRYREPYGSRSSSCADLWFRLRRRSVYRAARGPCSSIR